MDTVNQKHVTNQAEFAAFGFEIKTFIEANFSFIATAINMLNEHPEQGVELRLEPIILPVDKIDYKIKLKNFSHLISSDVNQHLQEKNYPFVATLDFKHILTLYPKGKNL